jgi:hypothetical protein
MSGETLEERAELPFGLGESEPEDDWTHVSVTATPMLVSSFLLGGTYWVFRRFLGISSSSSDHSASASTNGLLSVDADGIGDSSNSAEGQVSFSALAVEFRRSSSRQPGVPQWRTLRRTWSVRSHVRRHMMGMGM